MAGKLASLIIKISANGAEAEAELKKLERKMSNFSKDLQKIGTSMSKYITAPVTALAGVSVAAANTQLQAEAKLLNALKGRSDIQQRLMAQASELQSRSLFGDEEIINQQAFLAALGLTEQQIGETVEAAAQLSSALGISLDSAVKNLAKTYGGLTGELGVSIPSLKNLTAEQLKAGEAIKFVNDNYKGFAEAAASTGAGPLVQLKNIVGDIAESFGVVLIPILQKVANKLKELGEWFQNLSPTVKGTLVAIGSAAAVIGPSLVAFSKLSSVLKLVALAFPAISSAITALTTGPLGVAIAAVTALSAAWLAARVSMKAYYEEEELDNRKARGSFRKTYNYYKDITGEDFDKAYNEIERAYNEAQTTGKSLEIYEGAYKAISRIKREREEEQKAAQGVLTVDMSILDALKQIDDQLEDTTLEVNKIVDKVAPIAKPESFKGLSLADSDNLLSLSFDKQLGNTTLAANQMSAFWQDFADKAQRSAELIDDVAQIIESSLESLATSMAEGLGNMLTGVEFDPGKVLLELLGKSLKSLGAALISYAISMKAFKDSLKNIFNNPWGAVVAGIAATALGQAFINMAKEPIKLANGGLAYGPTLAVVGDNRGASSDPEVIAPLSKLRNYMGGQQLELVGGVAFELRGDVARAILDRENVRLNRKG